MQNGYRNGNQAAEATKEQEGEARLKPEFFLDINWLKTRASFRKVGAFSNETNGS
jgi:hypothetical protein